MSSPKIEVKYILYVLYCRLQLRKLRVFKIFRIFVYTVIKLFCLIRTWWIIFIIPAVYLQPSFTNEIYKLSLRKLNIN